MSDELPAAPESQGDNKERKSGLLGRAQQGLSDVRQKASERSQAKVESRQAEMEAAAAQRAATRASLLASGVELYEYRVRTVRETLVGDKIDTSAVEALLNEWAEQGWHVRSITSASVAGRVGPGGTSGLIVVFERRVLS